MFGYIRISTNKQLEKCTQENQKKAIIEYANELSLNIVKIFEDRAYSGADNERPTFNKMIDKLDEVSGIIVYDLDRLTRDFEMGVNLIFLLKSKGKKLYIARTKDVQDFSSRTSQLINIIYTWVADLERQKIKERQKLGIKRFKEKFGRWGRKPKKIDWKKFDYLVGNKIISKRAFCRMFGIAPATLYRRLKNRDKEKVQKSSVSKSV